MKTHLFGKSLILFSFVSVILLSCSKNDNSLQPVIKPQVTSAPVIGSIFDSGSVNTNVRIMKMDLSKLPYTLYGSNEEVSYVTASTTVLLYVNQDGLIPAGEYAFSDSGTKSPFTFNSGVLMLTAGSDSNGTQSDKIIDGKINVAQNGDKYAVSLEINLASGMTASEIFTGSLAYADSK